MRLTSELLKNSLKQTSGQITLIIILGMVTWLNPDSFLWRDDWSFLKNYFQADYSLFKGEIGSDIKPLFQYVMNVEFGAFHNHFFLYQVVNTILLTGCAISFFQILKLIQIDQTLSFLISIFYLLHPVNFVNVLWISQQAELIHILLSLLSILFFQKYLKDENDYNSFAFLSFLLIQNYFFPNGMFQPLIFIIIYIMIKKKELWKKKFLIPVGVIFIFHLTFAIYIQSQPAFSVTQTGSILSDIPEKTIYLFKLISVSAWRIAVPNFNPQSSMVINFLPLIILGALLVGSSMNQLIQKHKGSLALGVGGTILSSVILSLTRYKQIEIHYYYTNLVFFYLCIILAVYLECFLLRFRRGLVILMTVVLAGQIVIDFHGKQIFTRRNIANQVQMDKAIQSGSVYRPFDDPNFSIDKFLIMDGKPAPETAVILYRHLKK